MATPRAGKRGSSAKKAAQAALRDFHPIVRTWFAETLGAPSAPQLGGWPAIASGENALILAPTGTGKTLAAFHRLPDRCTAQSCFYGLIYIIYT